MGINSIPVSESDQPSQLISDELVMADPQQNHAKMEGLLTRGLHKGRPIGRPLV
jgi:hypothetical protein